MASSLPVCAGLTAHYRLDESAGDLISADPGPAGRLEGSGSSWTVGQVGNALSVDGYGSGYVEDDTALEGNGGNNVTVSFWVGKPAGSQPGAVLLQKGFTDQVTYGFRIPGSGDGVEYVRDRAQGGFYTRAGVSSLTPDQWYHVVGVYNRNQMVTNCTPQNNMELFVNGVSYGTRASSGDLALGNSRFTLGSQCLSNGNFEQRFQGRLDDVGIWDDCLTYSKIAAIHALGRFERMECSDARIDSFLNTFGVGGEMVINGHPWKHTTGLVGAIGATGGTSGVDAWVVLDAGGNGMRTVPPPPLSVQRSGDELVLSWIGIPGLYGVQFRPDLPNAPTWAFITNQVSVNGSTNEVRMPPPGVRGFFRLAQQSSSPFELLMQCDIGGCGLLQSGWISLPTCATYPNVNGSGVTVTLATGVPAACACRDRTGSGALANVERDFLFADDQVSSPGGDFILTFDNLLPGLNYRLRSFHNRTDQNPSQLQGVVVTGATAVTTPAQINQDHASMAAPAEISFTATSNQVSIRYLAPTQAEAGDGAQVFLNGFMLECVPTVVWMPTVQFETGFSSGLELAGPAILSVVLSQALPQTITVNYAVTGGTATGGGVDYTLAPGTLTFPPGVTHQTILIPITNDGVDENDETIEVTLSNPGGGVALEMRTRHTYTIVDPRPKVSFVAESSSGLENASPVQLAVSLSAPSATNVTVSYAVTGGTATGGGVDFVLAAGTLTFPAGQVSTNINLVVMNDALTEPNETIVITLFNPVNATLGSRSQHTYTIVDDDSGVVWDNLTWFYSVAPNTRLFINASDQLEWNPKQHGQYVTRLPEQRLSQVGDKVEIQYLWLSDGAYKVCPEPFGCLYPGQNEVGCFDDDIYCIAGTSDMRVGLFESDGQYISADGYAVDTNALFSGYKGYSFRFGPNMIRDPGIYADPPGSGRWVDCRPEVHKTGAFHKKPAALSNLMFSNDNQKDYIFGFDLPVGQFSLFKVSVERISTSSVRLSITLNGQTQTWTDTSISEQPSKIDVLAIHMRNARPYTRVVLAKP